MAILQEQLTPVLFGVLQSCYQGDPKGDTMAVASLPGCLESRS